MPLLNDFEIKEIESASDDDQPRRFLDVWINKHRPKATREALCSALFLADLGSGAKQVLPEIYEGMTNVFFILIYWENCLVSFQDSPLDPDREIRMDELVYVEDKDFIGSGGYGEVYRATLEKIRVERTVAVKLFNVGKRKSGR